MASGPTFTDLRSIICPAVARVESRKPRPSPVQAEQDFSFQSAGFTDSSGMYELRFVRRLTQYHLAQEGELRKQGWSWGSRVPGRRDGVSRRRDPRASWQRC